MSALKRAASKLVIIGLLSQPAYSILAPLAVLNVMFTLFLGAWLALSSLGNGVDKLNTLIAFFIVIYAGMFVDHQWFGIVYVFTSCKYCVEKTPWWLCFWVLSLALLVFVSNPWCYLALPIIVTSMQLPEHALPRMRWFFYAYYPTHLSLIALLAAL